MEREDLPVGIEQGDGRHHTKTELTEIDLSNGRRLESYRSGKSPDGGRPAGRRRADEQCPSACPSQECPGERSQL